MSAGSGGSKSPDGYDHTLSDAYAANPNASAEQVQAVRNAEIAHQDSVNSGSSPVGNSGVSAPNTKNISTTVPNDVANMTPAQQAQHYSYSKLQDRLGHTPTAAEIQQNNREYQQAISGRAPNTSDSRVWNQYGEVIGQSPSGGYTDYSKEAQNAIVNPSFVKTPDNSYSQRTLTATNGTEKSFIDYSKLPSMADQWLKDNPGSDWDQASLVSAWKQKYADLNTIPSTVEKYAQEFGSKEAAMRAMIQAGINDEAKAPQASQPVQSKQVVAPVAQAPGVAQTTAVGTGGYAADPNWVGNIYPGAKWDSSTRTISTSDGRTLREGVDFKINPTDQRAYVLNNTAVVPTTVPTTTVAPVQTVDPYQNMMDQFYNRFSQYMTDPTANQETPTLDEYINTLYGQLSPQLDTQLNELNQNKKDSQESLTNDFIRRGFGWQGAHQLEASELNDKYTDSEANLRANFLASVVNAATPLYQAEISRVASSKSAYNQFMVNLGLQLMNGAIDSARFAADDSYRQATLAILFGDNALSNFGTTE